jgi:hypothetical protein
MLFLLFGSSASGKTTLVRRVAGRVDRVVGHDFDEIGVPAGADTAWRHRANAVWVERALEHQAQGVDLLLAGQTPLGELLASPRASELEAISGCLVDCDDDTRTARLQARGMPVDHYLPWAEWMRNHARDPQWMQHVIRIPETEGEMCWGRRIVWRVHTIDTSKLDRDAAAAELARWLESERASHARGQAGVRPAPEV